MAEIKPTSEIAHVQLRPRIRGAAAAYLAFCLSEKINFDGDCWEWHGAKRADGYGVVHLKHHEWPERTIAVHRIVYRLCVGELIDGMSICHACDNPSCCRPGHLFQGTNGENMLDKVAKGRQAAGDAVRVNHEHLKGETVVTAKATAELVMEMRQAEAGGESQTSIAQRTGLSQTQVSAIVRGESWAHLPVLMTGSRKNRTCPGCGLIVPTSLGRYRKHLEWCPARGEQSQHGEERENNPNT